LSVVETNLQYFSERQCSVQWRAFLRAYAAEFSMQGAPGDLRLFMSRLGCTMASSYPLRSTASLASLQTEMNRIWQEIDWGWVQLTEKPGYLCIEHHCSPLKEAFGEEALVWSTALLEGWYAQWFKSLSGENGLRLQQYMSNPGEINGVEFRLGRAV
jgi:hypothetical protein